MRSIKIRSTKKRKRGEDPLVERYPVVKKKLNFHFEPLIKNPFIKKALSCLPSKVMGGSLKMTIVWVPVLFCTAFMMKAEAFEGSFQLTVNIVAQKEIQ